VDEVFLKLMESAGVAEGARDETLAQLHTLRTRYPGETPARLFARARKEGGAIPASRCLHGIVHGDCVACNAKIGERFYFISAGTLVHQRPTCAALASERARSGGAAVEVTRSRTIEAGDLALCTECAPSRASRTPRASTTRRSPPSRSTPAVTGQARIVRPSAQVAQGPKPLDAAAPPAIGNEIDWGGFTGVVTAITDRGVTLDVDGVILTAPWGDRARVRRPS